jgi:hypothetical protein
MPLGAERSEYLMTSARMLVFIPALNNTESLEFRFMSKERLWQKIFSGNDQEEN